MRGVVGFGLGALATAAILCADMTGGMSTAFAQGGIVCDYGTARYKRCCRESYRNNPDLGPRGRARDIDACMNRESSEQPERSERRRERAREERGSRLFGGWMQGRLRRGRGCDFRVLPGGRPDPGRRPRRAMRRRPRAARRSRLCQAMSGLDARVAGLRLLVSTPERSCFLP